LTLLDLQVLALTLIPLFSAVTPSEGGMSASVLSMFGAEQSITAEFIAGTWKTSDEFFRWGAGDREKTKITPLKGSSYMSLRWDGTMKMVNFFRPAEGRWELTAQGLLIHDPSHPERGSQVLSVRKRDSNRIWILLPFAGGSTGIGMVRVSEEELERVKSKPDPLHVELPVYRYTHAPSADRVVNSRDHAFDEAEALIPAASRAGNTPVD